MELEWSIASNNSYSHSRPYWTLFLLAFDECYFHSVYSEMHGGSVTSRYTDHICLTTDLYTDRGLWPHIGGLDAENAP